jgi:hypothetical protein
MIQDNINVRVFTTHSPEDLEDSINNIMEVSFPAERLVDIKYTVVGFPTGQMLYSAMVIFAAEGD